MKTTENLQNFLVQGKILYVEHPAIKDGIPHYWIVVNKEIKENDEVISVIATSQVEKVDLACMCQPKKQKKCVLFLTPKEEPFLSKDTVFDCNDVFQVNIETFKRLKVEEKGKVKDITLIWIKQAISESIIITPEIKSKIL